MVPLTQYRGNNLIDGQLEHPYDEDYWRKVRIGNMIAYVVKACKRCPIPGIDQDTSEHGAGGQKVLNHRLGYIFDPDVDKQDLKAVFGQNLNHVWEEGLTVQVGDQIEVLQRDNYRNFTLLSEAA